VPFTDPFGDSRLWKVLGKHWCTVESAKAGEPDQVQGIGHLSETGCSEEDEWSQKAINGRY
jgi:hypothetical protein